jgi:DnaJ-class molecular chaperone
MKDLPEPSLADWDKIQEENEASHVCPDCYGSGSDILFNPPMKIVCKTCNGTGRV